MGVLVFLERCTKPHGCFERTCITPYSSVTAWSHMEKEMLVRFCFLFTILLVPFVQGCSHFMKRFSQRMYKYQSFPAGESNSPLNRYLPVAEKLFRKKYKGRLLLRQSSMASERWSLERHRLSGRILRRAAKVWIGWERKKNPGECSVALYWIFQGRLSPGRWTALNFGRQVYRRTSYVGGRILCSKLAKNNSLAAKNP